MARRTTAHVADAFAAVDALGRTLPGVTRIVRYDGAPGLVRDGRFLAAIAAHRSAEPDTLVVRVRPDARQYLLDEAPRTYYLTDHYRPHPVVLVRLRHLSPDALRDVLHTAWRLAAPRTLGRAADQAEDFL